MLLAALLVFSGAKAQVDDFDATVAPSKMTTNAPELARYLCQGVVSDTLKARRIYDWVTHNIEYDIKAYKDPEHVTPPVQKILEDRKAICGGYVSLYSEMCKAVGLDAVPVAGYARSWTMDDSDKLYIPRHVWCAVKVDRRWELVDPTFGAGVVVYESNWWRSTMNIFSKDALHFGKKREFEFRYNPAYFLVDPIKLRYTHLPADPLWQLAEVHLPINVFQWGDSAITDFNSQNPQRINRAPELEYISRLNESQRIQDYADRAYKFNERYISILAIKESLKAAEALAKMASRRNIPQRPVFEDAYRGMVLADEYLDKQRSYFVTKYSTLKRNNIEKNRLAKDHFRDITVGNKRQIAQCRRRAVSAERKKEMMADRQDKIDGDMEDISYNKLDSIETITMSGNTNERLVKPLSDSIMSRQAQLKKLNFSVIDKMQGITLAQQSNEATWDSLKQCNNIADTLLAKEAIARIGFSDDYDNNIQALVYAFNSARFSVGDTLLNRYLQGIDTLVVYYEDLLKVYRQQSRVYKNLLRAMEQYKRYDDKDERMVSLYSSSSRKYAESISQYQQTTEVYQKYLEKNADRLNKLMKLFEEEINVVTKMEQAEDARKEAAEEAIEEDKRYDEAINEKMKSSVVSMKRELTDILSR